MQFYWSPEFQGGQKSYRSQKGIYSHFFTRSYLPPCEISLLSINVNDIEQLINQQLQGDDNQPDRTIACIEEYAKGYKTKNLIMNFGDDFVYTSAEEIFEFIEVFNSTIQQKTSRYELKYSTFTEYYNEVSKEIREKKIALKTYIGDFLPLYMQFEGSTWNGYYTSRPNQKIYLREFSYMASYSTNLYVSSQMFKRNSLLLQQRQMVNTLLKEQSILTHHDTITSTSVESVLTERLQKLNQTLYENSEIIDDTIKQFMLLKLDYIEPMILQYNQESSPLIKIVNGMNNFLIMHNPSTKEIAFPHLRFEDDGSFLSLKVWDDNLLQFDVIEYDQFNYTDCKEQKLQDIYPNIKIKPFSFSIIEMKYGNDIDEKEMHEKQTLPKQEEVTQLLNHGNIIRDTNFNKKYKSSVSNSADDYYIELEGENFASNENIQNSKKDMEITTSQCTLRILDIQNSRISLKLRDQITEHSIFFFFEIRYYQSYDNGNSETSGIYVFKTKDADSKIYNLQLKQFHAQHGDNVSQFNLQFSSEQDGDAQIFIKMKEETHETGCGEIEFDVHSMGIEPNKDVTVNWIQPDISNNGVFYTDSNGLEFIKRKKKGMHEQDKDYDLSAPQNFYPINSAIFIEDEEDQTQMIVINDRTQAGSGFREGSIELMYDRRILSSDSLGNPENLDERYEDGTPLRTNNKYYLRFTNSKKHAFKAIFERTFKTFNPTQYYYANDLIKVPTKKQVQSYQVNYKNFQASLDNLNIIDLKLSPDQQFQNITMWLVQENIEMDDMSHLKIINGIQELIKNYCRLLSQGEDFKCNRQFKIKPNKLTGQYLDLDGKEFKSPDSSILKLLAFEFEI
ncbi:glycosyl hydrolases family 38 protein [Stylonychia lemnae]|uniref:Glycosyl hydrolases family 38 protein n=1 Tax=Stylonychia lemnae TaxID=5949 RepID=A0A078A550_STYLE|nr:glycosyl hydrolases family 38 protein [Stylonychia lemnae]|eukprot:CDW76999.1 glycosyl hydrolases family 38 protein [Stylonychia lemnae]